MEKQDVILSPEKTPLLWKARADSLTQRESPSADAGTEAALAFPTYSYGAELPDGSIELIHEGKVVGKKTDCMATHPDGREAIINFHGERTTLFGDLPLDEVEELCAHALSEMAKRAH